MYNIRLYKETDKEEIERWLKFYNSDVNLVNRFPKDSTFIAEIDNKPGLIMSLYLTICGNFSFVENGFGNPDLKGPKRKEAFSEMMLFLERLSKDLNYGSFIFWTYEPKITQKHKDFGY